MRDGGSDPGPRPGRPDHPETMISHPGTPVPPGPPAGSPGSPGYPGALSAAYQGGQASPGGWPAATGQPGGLASQPGYPQQPGAPGPYQGGRADYPGAPATYPGGPAGPNDAPGYPGPPPGDPAQPVTQAGQPRTPYPPVPGGPGGSGGRGGHRRRPFPTWAVVPYLSGAAVVLLVFALLQVTVFRGGQVTAAARPKPLMAAQAYPDALFARLTKDIQTRNEQDFLGLTAASAKPAVQAWWDNLNAIGFTTGLVMPTNQYDQVNLDGNGNGSTVVLAGMHNALDPSNFDKKPDVPLERYQIGLHFSSIKAIGQITAVLTLSKCFNADGSNPSYDSTNFYCSLISRDKQTGIPDSVQTPLVNLGGYRTAGVDIQADWRVALDEVGLGANSGSVSLSVVATYLSSFRIQTLPGTPFTEYAGTIGNTQVNAYDDTHPRWKLATSVGYALGPVTTSLRWRYIDSMSNASNVNVANATARGVDHADYFDLDGTWKVRPDLKLTIGVINLANKQPPLFGTTIGTTSMATYDVLGRRFYLRLDAHF